MNATAGAVGRPTLAGEREFFRWLTIAIGIAVFVGFARSFYLHALFPARPVPPERFFQLHGAVFTLWFALLIAQAQLVTGGRIALHRTLGYGLAAVAALMVVLGIYGALIAAARPTGFVGLPIPGLVFLAVPLVEIAVFAVLIAIAIARRGEPAVHKRLMLIASASMTGAAFARWPLVGDLGPPGFLLASDLPILAIALFDRRRLGRLHPATVWGGGAVLLSQPLQLLLGQTAAWTQFARWAVSLVA